MCVFMLLLVAMCFCACAEVRTMTVTNKDGTIDEIVYISLDAAAVAANGQDLLLVQKQVEQGCQEVCKQIVEEFNTRALLNPGKQILLNAITPFSTQWEDATYSVRLRFENQSAYDFYYNRTEASAVEPQTEHHFLYDKIIYTGYTSFAQTNSLFGRLNTYFNINYGDVVDLSGGKLKYTIIAENRREHSNANYVNKVDGKYYHTWELSMQETNKQISLYYNLANRGNCILVCVGCALGVCAVLLLVGFILTKFGKKAE